MIDFHRQSGFTLMEVILALFIGTFITGTALFVFKTHNDQTIAGYTTQELQANSRTTQHFLTRALKNAGSGIPAAAGISPVNQINYEGAAVEDPEQWNFVGGFNGFFPGGRADPRAPKPQTDAVFLATGNLCNELEIAGTNPEILDIEHRIHPGGLTNLDSGGTNIRLCMPTASNCLSAAPLGATFLILGKDGGNNPTGFFVRNSNIEVANAGTAGICAAEPHLNLTVSHLAELNFGVRGLPTKEIRAHVITGGLFLYYVSNDNSLVRLPLAAGSGNNSTIADLEEIAPFAEDFQIEYNVAQLGGGAVPQDTCLGVGEVNCPFAPWDPATNPEHLSANIRLVRYQMIFAQLDRANYLNQGKEIALSDHTAVNTSADSFRRRRHETVIFAKNVRVD